MKSLFGLSLLLALLVLASVSFAGDAAAVLGTWEGESKCTVPDSPCHDEHVIYEITQEKTPGRMKMDAYKVVRGEKDFMGTLFCTWQAPRLSCSYPGPRENHWEFVVNGAELTGTLVVGKEKTLFRRVAVRRQR